ncbi:unnamed protein product [Lasius platythorax]|uniref:Uncharacterized protein n=1 Tax=Lasius platythorax TaxID=488582 RepID=A0AAV2NDK4_9HYME
MERHLRVRRKIMHMQEEEKRTTTHSINSIALLFDAELVAEAAAGTMGMERHEKILEPMEEENNLNDVALSEEDEDPSNP